MDCHNVTSRFSDLRDGQLSGEQLVEVRQHLSACLACRQEWAEFQQAIETLRSLGAAQPSPGFAGRVRAQIESQPWYRRLARRLFVPWRIKLPLEVAALVLLAVGTIFLYQRSTRMKQVVEQPESQPPPAPIVAARRDALRKEKPEVQRKEMAKSERGMARRSGQVSRPRAEEATSQAETGVTQQVGPTADEEPSPPPAPTPSTEAGQQPPPASDQGGEPAKGFELKSLGESVAGLTTPRLDPTPFRILTLRTTEAVAAEKRIGEWIRQTGGRLLDQPAASSPTAPGQRTLSLYIPVRAIPAFDALLADLGQVFGKELSAPSSNEALISLTISSKSPPPLPAKE